MLCAVYTMHVEMRSAGFLVEPQKQGQRLISDLASKPLGQFSPFWSQNRWRRFSPGLASKPVATVSPDLASKLVARVS
jgi:hypothetical protein